MDALGNRIGHFDNQKFFSIFDISSVDESIALDMQCRVRGGWAKIIPCLTVEKFKIYSLFRIGEMPGSEKIQGAQSYTDKRSGFFR